MRAVRLDKLDRIDGIDVVRVDGHRIRDLVDVEFTNGHHHFSRSYVPLREIWLDRDAAGREWPFWAQRQIYERWLMADGVLYSAAVVRGARYERKLRGWLRKDVRFARRRWLGTVADREVWLVDGGAVRNHAYVDFTLGGHGFRYRFIPRREIWIDDAVRAAERPAIVHHEGVELAHMRSGMRYDEAHALASKAEIAFRRKLRIRQ